MFLLASTQAEVCTAVQHIVSSFCLPPSRSTAEKKSTRVKTSTTRLHYEKPKFQASGTTLSNFRTRSASKADTESAAALAHSRGCTKEISALPNYQGFSGHFSRCGNTAWTPSPIAKLNLTARLESLTCMSTLKSHRALVPAVFRLNKQLPVLVLGNHVMRAQETFISSPVYCMSVACPATPSPYADPEPNCNSQPQPKPGPNTIPISAPTLQPQL